jgi:hypothetical protein
MLRRELVGAHLMADGDLSMTVTVTVPGIPTLVTNPRTGRGAGERDGHTITAQRGELTPPAPPQIGKRGTGAQEDNGNIGKGRTGRIS